ncbi:hypothetical protein ACHMW7_09260 [Aminobacter sp. UC22_36]|uniref:hypothetical protein n=1 Tax=Aminobacter sp. UC22_36 TaxID=3374549 RepID=UPI0037567B9F
MPWFKLLQPNLKLFAATLQSSEVLVDMRFRHRQQDIDVIEACAIIKRSDPFP